MVLSHDMKKAKKMIFLLDGMSECAYNGTPFGRERKIEDC
jgi:hypothetical protein